MRELKPGARWYLSALLQRVADGYSPSATSSVRRSFTFTAPHWHSFLSAAIPWLSLPDYRQATGSISSICTSARLRRRSRARALRYAHTWSHVRDLGSNGYGPQRTDGTWTRYPHVEERCGVCDLRRFGPYDEPGAHGYYDYSLNGVAVFLAPRCRKGGRLP